MVNMIDPAIYVKNEHKKQWTGLFPEWMSSRADLVRKGSYIVPQHDQSRILIGGENPACFSNICTHKNATILKGRGDLGSVITCPIHKWSWNLDGSIRGARGFEKSCSMDLAPYQIHEWNGHLFTGNGQWMDDLQLLGNLGDYLDISGYKWHSASSIDYSFDWKIFMEIFLDLYHVQSFHPGLSSLTDCKTFGWVFGKNWSCQTADFNRNPGRSSQYNDLYTLYKKSGHYDNAVYGAVWLGIYPNIMIEYYPGCIVVSTVWPNGPGRCTNHLEFYYEDGLIDTLPEFPFVQQRCFMVTADEDEIIGNRMQEGLSMLDGPFKAMNHPVEEAGYRHFHDWLSCNLYQQGTG